MWIVAIFFCSSEKFFVIFVTLYLKKIVKDDYRIYKKNVIKHSKEKKDK